MYLTASNRCLQEQQNAIKKRKNNSNSELKCIPERDKTTSIPKYTRFITLMTMDRNKHSDAGQPVFSGKSLFSSLTNQERSDRAYSRGVREPIQLNHGSGNTASLFNRMQVDRFRQSRQRMPDLCHLAAVLQCHISKKIKLILFLY